MSLLIAVMNSWLAYSWIKGGQPRDNKHANLIIECQELIQRSWTVELKHVCKEQNEAADILAK